MDLKKLLMSKKVVVNKYLIDIALREGFSLQDFLVLAYLENGYCDKFEIDLISRDLGISDKEIMESFNNLMMKGLVALDSKKDYSSKYNEVINLEGLYEKINELVDFEQKEFISDNLFKSFEQELGRTLSPMELELINGWLSSGVKEELILGALREAIYNNVSNFRYIDKIIYEWDKKGFKTMEDVHKHLRSRREEKSKKKDVSSYEQEILDYDWLGE